LDFDSIDYGFEYEAVYTGKGRTMEVAAYVCSGIFGISFLWFLCIALSQGDETERLAALFGAFVWLVIGGTVVGLLLYYASKNIIH
jgi:hypothetical protein